MRPWRKPARAGFLPVFFATMLATLLSSVLRTVFALALPVVALMWFGQPAVLVQYWTHGPRSYPVYEKCQYLALDGWHVVIPGYRGSPDVCPAVKLVPADIGKLIWG